MRKQKKVCCLESTSCTKTALLNLFFQFKGHKGNCSMACTIFVRKNLNMSNEPTSGIAPVMNRESA